MPGTEVLDVVDEHDRVVGEATIEVCLSEGRLHRAVAVLVARRDGRLVLQQRSASDLWQPGKWTLSCTGHVRKGEDYPTAGARELKEELGIEAQLKQVGKYLVPPITDGRLTEHEWTALFFAETDAALRPDPEELQDARDFSEREVEAMMRERRLTEDAVILMRRFLEGTRQ